jgi:HSP20 family protein
MVGAFMPPADLLVTDDGVTVYMDVPGLRPENLEIELENDVLTVHRERRTRTAARRAARPGGSNAASARSSAARAPGGLDPDAIEASLSDGILMLRIPKPKTARSKRIEIKASTNGQSEQVLSGQPAETSSGQSQQAGAAA